MEKKIKLENLKATCGLAEQMAAKAEPGTVIALIGDLGTGKTAFTKAFAKALGVESVISSPTFTIVQEYEDGRLPLYHFDVYRVNDEDELFEIGFDEYLNGSGVCLIEWADLVEDLLTENTIFVKLEYSDTEGSRLCTISCKDSPICDNIERSVSCF